MAEVAKKMPYRNGVLQVIPHESRNYYTVDDVMNLLGIKQAKAYNLIRALRKELIAKGYLIEEYPVGRIPKRYFDSRCGIDKGTVENGSCEV